MSLSHGAFDKRLEYKMNIEICKKCPNYPDWYELVSQNKFELVFQGYKKSEDLVNLRMYGQTYREEWN